MILIQKPKQPKGNPISRSIFYIIYCQITIRQFFDLFKRFSLTSYFESIGIVNTKISLSGKSYFMSLF